MDLKLLLTGSSAEGQSNCCQFAEYNIGPDIDIIIIFGTLDSEDELIKIKECPHYVRVKWNNTTLASLSHSDDKQYVNGFKMKQDHLLFIANHNQNDLYKRRMKSEISSQTAAIKVSAGGIRENFDSYAYSKNFKEALDKIEENRKNSKLMIMLKENYMIYYQYLTDTIKTQLPIFHEILFSDRPPLTCNDTDIHLTSPAFNIPLTMEHKQKARALIHFYKSHKKLSYPDLFSNIFEMINSIPNFDMDLVPALELKFWPKNVIPFLNRLKKNRCDLYEKISTTYMHLVAKESPTSLDNDKEYDFRYSFSVIEKILANERTKNEKILNGVAKNIYYKHLYKNTTSQQGKEQYIRSYLVKTTIFWMCEQQHDDINNVEGKNNDEIGKKLAYMWIQFTTKLLSNSLVKHYFIESVNLLDSYADDSRRTALHILQNDINLDDQTLISSTKNVCGELINLKCDQYIQYQYFLKTLRAIDIKQVRDDFVKLREQWFPKTVNDRNTNVLDILNNFALYDDGNGDEDTWTRWERLICNYDNLETLPLSYEISDCNPEQFVDSLSSSAFILNNMINIVSNIDYINEIKLFNGDDFKNTSQLYNNLKSIKQISQNHNTVDLLFKILIFIEPPIIQDCFLLDKRCLLDTHPDDPQAVSIKSLTLKKLFTDIIDILNTKCNYSCSVDYLTIFANNRQPTHTEILAKYLEITQNALQYMPLETFVNALTQYLPDIQTSLMQRWFPHHKLIDIVDEVDKLKRHCGYISLIDYLTMFDNNRQPTLEECLAKRSEIMLDALNHMSFDTFLDATMPECKFLSTLAANTERSTFISQMTNLNLQHKAEIFLDVKDRFNKAQNYMSSIDYSTMFNDDPQPTLENITAQTTKITLDALNRVSVDEFFGSVMCENINMLKNQCAKETSFPNLSSIQSSPKLCYLSVPRDHSCCFTSLYFLLVSSVDDYRFRSDPNYRFVCTQELRNIIAQVIEQNPSTYTDEILEKSRRDYCQWLRHPDMWGGDIELSICSNLYFVEICVINLHLQNPNEAIYRIGENDGHPTRIFLTYDGKHYNPTFTCINNEVHKRTRCDDIEIMTLAQNKQIEDYELSTLVISTEMESVTPQTMDLKTQLMVNNLTDFVNTLKEKCSYISPIDYLTMFDNNRQPTSEELNAKYTEIMMDALHHMSCDTLVNGMSEFISDMISELGQNLDILSKTMYSTTPHMMSDDENNISSSNAQQQQQQQVDKKEMHSLSSLSLSPTDSKVRISLSTNTSRSSDVNSDGLLPEKRSKRREDDIIVRTSKDLDRLPDSGTPYQQKRVETWTAANVSQFLLDNNLDKMAMLLENSDGNTLLEVYQSCKTNRPKMYDYLNEELQCNHKTTMPVTEYHRFISELRRYIKTSSACTIF